MGRWMCPPFLATSFTYSIHEAHGHEIVRAHKVVDFSETQSEYRINIFYLSRWFPGSSRLFNPELWMQKEGKDIPRNTGNQELSYPFLFMLFPLLLLLSHSVAASSLWPHGLYPSGSFSLYTFRKRVLEWLPFPFHFPLLVSYLYW